eukprot:jgi/Galph1/2843/GphlegSOOS_G1536.1
MFSLIDSVWKQLSQVTQYAVVILGSSGSGKTMILERLKDHYSAGEKRENKDHPPKVRPTVGLNVAHLKVENAIFLVWDFGGKKQLRPIWERYVNDASAVVFVIDATCANKTEEDAQLLRELLERKELSNKPFLIYINKQDMSGVLSLQEVAEILRLPVEVHRPRWLQDCSAEQNTGIKEGFEWLRRHLFLKDKYVKNGNKTSTLTEYSGNTDPN